MERERPDLVYGEDPLRAARGVWNGMWMGFAIWIVLFITWWMMFR
jgi:hypothetical protein